MGMRGHLGIVWLLPLLSASASAAPAPRVQSADEARAEGIPIGPALQVRVAGGAWRAVSEVEVRRGDRVVLRVHPAPPPGADVRWQLVFADITKPYDNAHPPGSPNAYQWRGIAPIDTYRVELPALRGQREVAPFEGAGPLHAGVRAWLRDQGRRDHGLYHDDVGTFRFQAVVEHRGERVRTRGVEELRASGDGDGVLRVSVRADDSLIGHLWAFANVPGVFGSTTRQSWNYLGVDCADALMAAFGRRRGAPPRKNYNVAGLVAGGDVVARLRAGGDALEGPALRWGVDVEPGDFVAVRYPGAKRFQHIGALEADADGDGRLSGADTVLHVGPWPLQRTRLKGGMFAGELVVFRPLDRW